MPQIRSSKDMNRFEVTDIQRITFVRHNDLRDITAQLLSKVCNDVAIEPPLQSLSGEVIS